MDWRDVEVKEESAGKLALRLCGKTAEVAHSRGVVGQRISWSHTRDYAVGMVLLILDGSKKTSSV
jgi:phosphopantetheinyl transferase (holo-ACP synthase)